MTLAALLQEHFDGVLDNVESGRWGAWVLDRQRAHNGRLVLVHDSVGYTVTAGTSGDWMARVAEQDWATADDVGQLMRAIRDLEYALWLGLLSASGEPAPAGGPVVAGGSGNEHSCQRQRLARGCKPMRCHTAAGSKGSVQK